MHDSSISSSFSPSPAHMLSQMSDPTSLLSNLCSPFLTREISVENFGEDVVQILLIPNVKSSILNREFDSFKNIPELIKIIVDNLGEKQIEIVKKDILESIIDIYLAKGSEDEERNIVNLYCDTISSISSRFRDDILVEYILLYSSSDNVKLRILAAILISLVRRNSRILSQFQMLVSDPSPEVRVTIVKSLPNYTFKEHLIESTLNFATNDESNLVRNAAASVFGILTPHLIEPYLVLLLDPETTVSALSCFQQMVSYSEFSIFYRSFIEVIKNFPKESSKSLLQIAPIVDPCEHRYLYKCAKMLRNEPTFVESFYQFTRCFYNKKKFLVFFDPKKMNNDTIKLYEKQWEFFMKDLDENNPPTFADLTEGATKKHYSII